MQENLQIHWSYVYSSVWGDSPKVIALVWCHIHIYICVHPLYRKRKTRTQTPDAALKGIDFHFLLCIRVGGSPGRCRWSPMCKHFSTKYAQREIQCTCADSRTEDTLSLWHCGHCTSMTHCTERRKGLRGFKDSSVELVIIHYTGFLVFTQQQSTVNIFHKNYITSETSLNIFF